MTGTEWLSLASWEDTLSSFPLCQLAGLSRNTRMPGTCRTFPADWHALLVTGRHSVCFNVSAYWPLFCIITILEESYRLASLHRAGDTYCFLASKESIANSQMESSHLKTRRTAAAGASHLCSQNIGTASPLLSDGIFHIQRGFAFH